MNQDIQQKKETSTQNPWELAWNLGWQIAIPLVLFALIGRFADNYFGTTPWLLVLGVILAAVSSTYLVFRKVAKLLQ